VQYGHDVSDGPILAFKVLEVDVVLIGTEHFDRDYSVEPWVTLVGGALTALYLL
jgi:hypothetical protein